MKHVEDTAPDQVVMPVAELHGRTVWSESGERLGVVREVNQDDDGRIVSLSVRERWMFGPHHTVSAAGMRFDGGDVIVPMGAVLAQDDVTHRRAGEDTDRKDAPGPVVARRQGPRFARAPVLLSGREGARSRFGGLDIIGSVFGALVTIGSLVLLGGLLGAALGSDVASIDTSLATIDDVLTESLLVAAAVIFLSCFLGGWAAGRSARFDGVANGMMSAVWVLVIGVALAAVGALLGDEYDVLANADLPRLVTDDFALWGSVALGAALVLMLIGGALGGALGESWHRRADRAMMNVVSVDDREQETTGVEGSSEGAPVISDGDAVPTYRPDRRPR